MHTTTLLSLLTVTLCTVVQGRSILSDELSHDTYGIEASRRMMDDLDERIAQCANHRRLSVQRPCFEDILTTYVQAGIQFDEGRLPEGVNGEAVELGAGVELLVVRLNAPLLEGWRSRQPPMYRASARALEEAERFSMITRGEAVAKAMLKVYGSIRKVCNSSMIPLDVRRLRDSISALIMLFVRNVEAVGHSVDIEALRRQALEFPAKDMRRP